jgi:hypothetical protein
MKAFFTVKTNWLKQATNWLSFESERNQFNGCFNQSVLTNHVRTPYPWGHMHVFYGGK